MRRGLPPLFRLLQAQEDEDGEHGGHGADDKHDAPRFADDVRASEIGEDRLGPRERGLGVDEPVLLAQRCEIGGEGRAVVQAVELAEECQPARRMGVGEQRQEGPPEQAG